MNIVFTDRYDALGIRPPRIFYCQHCDALGYAECSGCHGTGKATGLVWRAERIWHFLRTQTRFARHHVFVLPYPPFPVRVWAERPEKGWLWNRRLALSVLFRLR